MSIWNYTMSILLCIQSPVEVSQAPKETSRFFHHFSVSFNESLQCSYIFKTVEQVNIHNLKKREDRWGDRGLQKDMKKTEGTKEHNILDSAAKNVHIHY